MVGLSALGKVDPGVACGQSEAKPTRRALTYVLNANKDVLKLLQHEGYIRVKVDSFVSHFPHSSDLKLKYPGICAMTAVLFFGSQIHVV